MKTRQRGDGYGERAGGRGSYEEQRGKEAGREAGKEGAREKREEEEISVQEEIISNSQHTVHLVRHSWHRDLNSLEMGSTCGSAPVPESH